MLEKLEDPILKPIPGDKWRSRAVTNPGSVVRGGEVYLLVRAIAQRDPNYISRLGLVKSADGFGHFEWVSDQPVFEPRQSDGFPKEAAYEDPRMVKGDDLLPDGKGKVVITYVVFRAHPYTPKFSHTAIATTKDFNDFDRLGTITPEDIDDRDTVVFPKKDHNGQYVILHRPQEIYPDGNGGLVYREVNTCEASTIWIAHTPSLTERLTEWDMGKRLLVPREEWEEAKIGIGPPPLETDFGWIGIHHGVDRHGVYRAGAFLLDLDDPSRVISRLPAPILAPTKWYETTGDRPGTVFPQGVELLDDEVVVYYGAADDSIGVAKKKLKSFRDAFWRHRKIF